MKKCTIVFCLLLGTAFGHQFDKSVLENISVSGNVPKPGNVDLADRSSITIRGALESAGFDVARLKTTKRPYPFAIVYGYIAERTPGIELVLTNENSLSRSLAIEVYTGGSIGVTDFEKESQILDELKKQINSGWEDSPQKSYYRLQQIVSLEEMIVRWKNPERPVTKAALKKAICAGLAAKSSTALHQEISSRISELKAIALENGWDEQHRFVSGQLEDLNAWIPISDPKETPEKLLK